MNCREVRNSIQSYIDGKLEEDRIMEFIEHVEQCPACLEDLQVQYAIVTAIRQLNEGKDFSDDYNRETLQLLEHDRMRIRANARRRILQRLVMTGVFVALGMLIGMGNQKRLQFVHLPETEQSSFSLNYYGIEKRYDPVYQGILQYNDEVVGYLMEKRHEAQEKHQSQTE